MNSLLILEGTPGRYEIEGQVFYGCCTKIVFNAQEEHWLYLLSVHSIIESFITELWHLDHWCRPQSVLLLKRILVPLASCPLASLSLALEVGGTLV